MSVRPYLHLEDVLSTPLAVGEREVELVGLEECFHDPVHVHLVARDVSRPVRRGLLPLNADVVEVASPGSNRSFSFSTY